MTETGTVTGITAEELRALRAGNWEDDGGPSPGWRRWIGEGPRDAMECQMVFPARERPGWVVTPGRESPDVIYQDFPELKGALAQADAWASGQFFQASHQPCTDQAGKF